MKKNKFLISILFSGVSLVSPFLFSLKENKNFEISNINLNASENVSNKNSLTLTIKNNGSALETFNFKIEIKENFIDINSLKDLSKNSDYFNKIEQLVNFDFETNNNDEAKKMKIKNNTLNLLSILFQGYFDINTKKVSFYKNNSLDSAEKEINFFENTSKAITSKKLKSTLSNEQNKIKLSLKESVNQNNEILFEWDFNSIPKTNNEVKFINQLNSAIKIIDVSNLFSFSLDNLDIKKNYYTYSYDMFNGSNMSNQPLKTLMYAINKPKNNSQNNQDLNGLINDIDSIDLTIKETNSTSMSIKEYKRNIKFSNDNKIDYSFLDLPFEKDVTITNIKINTKSNTFDSSFLNSSKDIEMKMKTEKDKLNKIHLSNSITVNIDSLYKKIDKTKSLIENLKIIENEIKTNSLSIKFFEFDDLLNTINNETNKKTYDDLYKLVIEKAFDNKSDWYHINLSYVWVDYENQKGYIRLVITSNDGKELINTFIKEKNDNNAPMTGGSSSSNGNSTSGNNSIANGNQENNYQSINKSSGFVDKWIIYVGIEIILIIVTISIIFLILNKNKPKEKI